MGDRRTTIDGDQIRNLTITGDDIRSGSLPPENLEALNNPTEGYMVVYREVPSGSGIGGDNTFEWMPAYVTFVWVLNQRIRTGTTQDAIRIAPMDLNIINANISLVDAGNSGNTIVDINKGDAGAAPTTIFTTQANRPSLAGGSDWGVASSGVPDITSVTAGQIITCDIDEIAIGNPSDLVVQLHCEVA